MKTIPLVGAQIKGFLRNWRSIVLLIVFPFVLISILFLSFNPEGMQKVPIGIIGSGGEFDIDNYGADYFPFLHIVKYQSAETCLAHMEQYRRYACIEVMRGNEITLNVYYDNTREPIIWEIIERIKLGVEAIQKEKSKEIASGFLTKFSNTRAKLNRFQSNLNSVSYEIDSYITGVDTSAAKMRQGKEDLSRSLDDMDRDINEVESEKNQLEYQKNIFYSSSMNSLDSLQQAIYYAGLGGAFDPQINQVKNDINNYDGQANSRFRNVDRKISSYRQKSSQGRYYVGEIESGIQQLQLTRQDLVDYKQDIRNLNTEIGVIQADFASLEGVSAEQIVSPVVMRNFPNYVPIGARGAVPGTFAEQAKQAAQGFNLITLQTIFPKMLVLIALFLSLLISSFVCVNEINSPAKKRLNIIKRIFIHEFLSIFISSLLIVSLPMLCVMILGTYLFRLDILFNPYSYLILLLLSSIFILIGLNLSYLIKKESTTILVSTFVLVLLLFFSGYVLPIEKMSWASFVIARGFPGNLALSAFNQAVFYGGGMESFGGSIYLLVFWVFLLSASAIVIKKIRSS